MLLLPLWGKVENRWDARRARIDGGGGGGVGLFVVVLVVESTMG